MPASPSTMSARGQVSGRSRKALTRASSVVRPMSASAARDG
jgi:hypothetical protein